MPYFSSRLKTVLEEHGLDLLERSKILSSGSDQSHSILDLWAQWFYSFEGSTVRLLKHRLIEDINTACFIEELIDKTRQEVSKYIIEWLNATFTTVEPDKIERTARDLGDISYDKTPIQIWVYILTVAGSNPAKFFRKHGIYDPTLIETGTILIDRVVVAASKYRSLCIDILFEREGCTSFNMIDSVYTPRDLWAKYITIFKGDLGRMLHMICINRESNDGLAIIQILDAAFISSTCKVKLYIKPILITKGFTSEEIDKLVISSNGCRAYTDLELWAQWKVSALSLDEFLEKRSVTDIEKIRFIKSLLALGWWR